ncbi:MAG: hypothetical protein C4297_08580 [Gemmataceae bacterium]
MTPHTVILGGGPAAINAIETIRLFDAGSSRITLVSDEPAYARMALPYYLADTIPLKHLFTADADYYDRLKVQRRIGPRAVEVRPQQHLVKLSDGTQMHFDSLLIATGSAATIPPIPGADLPGVWPLWTLGHTQALLRHLQGLSRPEIAFVGAGFIGLIVLNAAYKRGWKLHLIEIADQVLPRMLDRESARMAEKWLQDKGVGVHLNTTVERIAEHGTRKRLRLRGGDELEVDAVVLATGIRPNIDFLADSGILIDQGIVVNDRMQTNYEFIYAAGDVAQGPDLLGGPPAVHAIQPTAVDHGRVAGANIAGRDVRYSGSLLMNILDVCGLQCASFGRWADTSLEAMTLANAELPVYRKLLWEGDRLVGAILVGAADNLGMLNDLGMIKGLIQARIPFGTWKEYLRDNPFDVRRPFIGLKVGKKLAETTLLGLPAVPRQFRFGDRQPRPMPTLPQAHTTYVETKP